MGDISLAALLADVENTPHDFITLTRYANPLPGVVDTQYVAVTEAAAELHGYPNATAMVGKYLSQTTILEDYKRGSLLSLARSLGLVNHRTYTVTLVSPDGHLQPIFKRTMPLVASDGRYWVTRLEPIDRAEEIPAIDLEDLRITPQQVVEWAGLCTVVECEAMLHAQFPESSVLDLTSSYISNTVSHMRRNASENAAMSGIIEQALVLEPGGTIRLPEGDTPLIRPFLHWCVRGNHSFQSAEEDPEQCGKCRKKFWRGDWVRDARRDSSKTLDS